MLPSLGQAGNHLAQAIATVRRRLALPAASAPVIPLTRACLSQLAQADALLPKFVAEDAVARKYLDLLGPLDWAHFPERPANQPWPGPDPAPRAPYVAAYLVKRNESLRSMGHLRRYLGEHPALVWILGFSLTPAPTAPHGFDVEGSLPSRRQCGRVLRELDNAAAQFLLDGTVYLIQQALPADVNFGDVIALDTKHIIAWVTENNPKAMSVRATTRPNSPRVTQTASSAANDAPIKGKAMAVSNPRPTPVRPPHRPVPQLPRPLPPGPPVKSVSASMTGGMLPASSPPKCRSGARSSWPNSLRPSTLATRLTSSH